LGGEVKAVNHWVNAIATGRMPAVVFIGVDHSTELRPLTQSQRVPGTMGGVSQLGRCIKLCGCNERHGDRDGDERIFSMDLHHEFVGVLKVKLL
jgi:hypothetical protein